MRYREVDIVKEKQLHSYVLENSSGMPSSIHATATGHGISNHYYNLVGDVKIYHMIRKFEVVN